MYDAPAAVIIVSVCYIRTVWVWLWVWGKRMKRKEKKRKINEKKGRIRVYGQGKRP